MSHHLRNALILAVLLSFAVLTPYFVTFGGSLSTSSQDWADFGSYAGGTLGPGFAFLAFIAGVQTLIDNRDTSRRHSLLATIDRFERDFDAACCRTVTCQSPWIWGKGPSDSIGITKVALRTLLYSDTVDWETYLPPLVTGHEFQVLESGEISQDREVIRSAQMAVDGIYEYLSLYREIGGEDSIVAYLQRRYEIPKNRIDVACQHAAETQSSERDIEA